ncbi:uncharacterized protein [Parasteatoda tepidariorum]|uniref:uncharacterized protein isoform X3 n=1 Tax=Parasteatoda tepidariorum TaxID=114398 RepID=UPI0039BD8426
MRSQHLIVLLSSIFLVDGQDECPENVVEVCGIPIQELKFPTSGSELEELCTNLKTFAECVINNKEICPDTYGPSLEFAQSLLKTSNTFCKSDSAWFKGAVKYGSCYDNFAVIEETIETCSPDIVNKSNLILLDVPDEPGLFQCYIDITTTVCVIDRMLRICGKMETELGLHFPNGIGFWNAFCLNNKETALMMMEEYELNFNPETTEEEFVTLFENNSASYGENKDMCLRNYKNLCQNPGDIRHDFPENSDDLSARCTAHIKYKECLIDYEQKCGEKIHGMSLHEDLETLNTFCDEKSVLFHALSDKGKCFNKCYQNYEKDAEDRVYSCIDEIKNKYPEKYELERNQRYRKSYNIRSCFDDLLMAKCLTEVISEDCGETAKELMLQALKINKLKYTMCRDFPKEAELFMNELDFSLEPQCPLEDLTNRLENESEIV